MVQNILDHAVISIDSDLGALYGVEYFLSGHIMLYSCRSDIFVGMHVYDNNP